MTQSEFTEWEDLPDALFGPRRQRYVRGHVPPKNMTFRVLRDEWAVGADGVDERTILEWELGPPVPEEDR